MRFLAKICLWMANYYSTNAWKATNHLDCSFCIQQHDKWYLRFNMLNSKLFPPIKEN